MSQWPAKFGKLIGYGAILSGLASLAFAGHPKIAQDLSNVKPDATFIPAWIVVPLDAPIHSHGVIEL